MTDQPPVNSASAPAAHQRHLFVVRVWWEPDDGNLLGEWRGSIEHVASRTKRYFREMETLPDLVTAMMRLDLEARGGSHTLPSTDEN